MLRAIFISLAFGGSLAACAAPPPTQSAQVIPRNISVLDVIDGDTIRIAGTDAGQTLSARLVGYDAPESFEPGCAAEKTLADAATRHLQLILRDSRDIAAQSHGLDRYDRVLLQLNVDGRDLADVMIAEGLAVTYDGGRRINWCDRLAAS